MEDIFRNEDYLLMRLIAQTRHAIQKARLKELAPFKISPRKAATLMTIVASGGEVSAYKIAKWFILEPSSISLLLQKMEKEGLVKRIKTQDKRRSFRLKLTAKGNKVYDEVKTYESYHRAMTVLNKEQRKQLKSLLTILRDGILKQLGMGGRLPFPPF